MYNGFKNKGLYHRDKTRKRKKMILTKIKDSQQNKCFFAKVRNPKTGLIHGEKYFLGYESLFGLIIENKIHYVSEGGIMRFAYTNKRGFKILEIYDNIPSWAPQSLIDKYKLFYINKVGYGTTTDD